MTSGKRRTLLGALICVAGLSQQSALAQSEGQALLDSLTPVTDAMLQNPPAEDWLMWRRTWDAYGFSPLDQINTDNVAGLGEAFRVPLEPGSSTPTPLVHDGVLFLLDANNTLFALDGSSGETLWHYQHKLADGAMPSSKLGIALHGDKVIMPTNDMHVLALNTKTGEVIWDHEVADIRKGA